MEAGRSVGQADGGLICLQRGLFSYERSGGRGAAHQAELERDDYMLFHDGRRLDLRDEAREALLLEVPMVPLCRPDCRGLCPRCGADWNEGPCPHVPDAGSA